MSERESAERSRNLIDDERAAALALLDRWPRERIKSVLSEDAVPALLAEWFVADCFKYLDVTVSIESFDVRFTSYREYCDRYFHGKDRSISVALNGFATALWNYGPPIPVTANAGAECPEEKQKLELEDFYRVAQLAVMHKDFRGKLWTDEPAFIWASPWDYEIKEDCPETAAKVWAAYKWVFSFETGERSFEFDDSPEDARYWDGCLTEQTDKIRDLLGEELFRKYFWHLFNMEPEEHGQGVWEEVKWVYPHTVKRPPIIDEKTGNDVRFDPDNIPVSREAVRRPLPEHVRRFLARYGMLKIEKLESGK